jgi:hypothetical protein
MGIYHGLGRGAHGRRWAGCGAAMTWELLKFASADQDVAQTTTPSEYF